MSKDHIFGNHMSWLKYKDGLAGVSTFESLCNFQLEVIPYYHNTMVPWYQGQVARCMTFIMVPTSSGNHGNHKKKVPCMDKSLNLKKTEYS